jgi:hypothetical protein
MAEVIDVFPRRPLTQSELRTSENLRAYCVHTQRGEAYAIVERGERLLYGYGFDPDAEGWVAATSTPRSPPEDAVTDLEDGMIAWLYQHLGEQIAAGDLEILVSEDSPYADMEAARTTDATTGTDDTEMDFQRGLINRAWDGGGGIGGSSEHSKYDANNPPDVVRQGLEAEYDCPECDLYTYGQSPHDFLDHLQDEHDYTRSEAFDVLQE